MASDLSEVLEYKQQLETLKNEYKSGEQNETTAKKLAAVDKAIAEAESVIAEKSAEVPAQDTAATPAEEVEAGYKVSDKERHFVHVRLSKGPRFSSMTGERLANDFIQKFSYGEWLNFRKNYKGLGYKVVEILHNPFKGTNL